MYLYLGKKMDSKKFYRKYNNKDKDLCSIFCSFCDKIAYSTKENKYMKDQCITSFDNLQCLNSSCPNGFSSTYQYCVASKSKNSKKNSNDYVQQLAVETAKANKYMERYSLN